MLGGLGHLAAAELNMKISPFIEPKAFELPLK
jgi:hypothetical protein